MIAAPAGEQATPDVGGGSRNAAAPVPGHRFYFNRGAGGGRGERIFGAPRGALSFPPRVCSAESKTLAAAPADDSPDILPPATSTVPGVHAETACAKPAPHPPSRTRLSQKLR